MVMEPINKNDTLRPRLSNLEIQIITECIGHFINRFNGTKLGHEEQAALKKMKQLHRRFKHLQKGSKFIRPRAIR